MKLVNQRHRVLLHHAFAQALSVFAMQGGVQAFQQVGKTKAAALALARLQARAHPACGVQAQRHAHFGQLSAGGLQGGKFGKHAGRRQVRSVGFARFLQACGSEALPAGFQVWHIVGQVATAPVFQGGEPLGVFLLAESSAIPVFFVVCGLPVQPVLHRLRALGPALAQLLHGVGALGAGLRQHLCQSLMGVHRGRGLRGQGAHVGHQRFHIAPDGQHLLQRRGVQRVAALAPVVLGGFGAQGFFVGYQCFVKQTAAVKSVFAQHALAPGVDGVDGGFVHALGGVVQRPGGLAARLAFGVVGQQHSQKRVGCIGQLATKALRRLQQPGANAVGQFARGGAGKGHHQNLRRAQGAVKAVRGAVGIAVAQYQAQVERGDRPGLAGARAGLDQVAAPQVQGVGLQGQAVVFVLRGHVASSSLASAPSALSLGCRVARTCVFCQSSRGW